MLRRWAGVGSARRRARLLACRSRHVRRALYEPVRCEGDRAMTGRGNLFQYIARVEDKQDDDDKACAAAPPTRKCEEETQIDLTEAETAALARRACAPPVVPSCLSPKESHVLTRMIYDAFYGSDGASGVESGVWYQAGLELRWLEEWARTAVAETTPDATETRRRLVKRAVLERVDLHKPLSYIIGSQPFFGCDIACVPPLLCPRPETEMWVHWVVSTHLKKATRPLRVLDMCCGTGCIGVAVARHVPLATVTCVDLLERAVDVTRENATRNKIEPDGRLRALQSDMFECFLDPPAPNGARRVVAAAHAASVDVLLANPPYVLPEQYTQLPPGITLWESKVALVGDDTRATQQHRYFQEICEYGVQLLKPRRARDPALRTAPNLCVEVGLQAELVASLMEQSGAWEDVMVHLDFAQQPRWVSANARH